MEFTRKNKLLTEHGRGLAKRLYEDAWRNLKASPKHTGTTFLGLLEESTKSRLDELKENHSQKETKKIIYSMAEGFIEKGMTWFAYEILKDTNKKRAKLIKKNFYYLL